MKLKIKSDKELITLTANKSTQQCSEFLLEVAGSTLEVEHVGALGTSMGKTKIPSEEEVLMAHEIQRLEKELETAKKEIESIKSGSYAQ